MFMEKCIRMKRVIKVSKGAKIKVIWASTRENLSSEIADNKGADQTAHTRRLISAFVIRFLKTVISRLVLSEIAIFLRVCVAEQAGLSLALSETPKTGFVATRSICKEHLR